MRSLLATVTVMALAMTVTGAHAAAQPLHVGQILAFSRAVVIEPVVPPPTPVIILVDGFGTPDPGQPLTAPWVITSGSLTWTATGDGIAKPGGTAAGANIAVIDAGRNDVAVQTVLSNLSSGPSGGAPTLTGLTLFSDGAGQYLTVTYRRQTGVLAASTSGVVLGSTAIGANLDVLAPLRAELRWPELRLSVAGTEVLVLTNLPPSLKGNTWHGVFIDRDNRAVLRGFRIETLP
jgi:hypothetical protein